MTLLKYPSFLIALCVSAHFYDQDIKDNYSLNALGSKTAYKYHGLRSSHPSRQTASHKLVHVNALYRHGSRSPEANFVEKMKEWRKRFEDHAPFKGFDFSIKCAGADSKAILPSGVKELKDLGSRLRSRVPAEFHDFHRSQVYTSPTDRTRASAEAFISTFFDKPNFITIMEDSERLRFYDNCQRYRRLVRKNKAVLTEYYDFLYGPHMQKVLEDIISDHDLKEHNLTVGDLVRFYKLAAHEVSVLPDAMKAPLTGWLRVFRPEHIFVLEYLHDLKHYWTKANAFPISYEQTCPLLWMMLEQMLAAAKHDMIVGETSGAEVSGPPRGVYWFGHAETLIPVVVKLGLFNESVRTTLGGGDHLRGGSLEGLASRFARLNSSKVPVPNLFRVAHISPFAGNLVFQVYRKLSKSDAPLSLEDYRVEVLLNEQVIDLMHNPLQDNLSLVTLLQRFSKCQPSEYDQAATCFLPSTSPRHLEL